MSRLTLFDISLKICLYVFGIYTGVSFFSEELRKTVGAVLAISGIITVALYFWVREGED